MKYEFRCSMHQIRYHLSILLFMILSIFACQKDSLETIKGSWKLDLYGAVYGNMPLNIQKLPHLSTGRLKLYVNQLGIEYDLKSRVSQSGVLEMVIVVQGDSIGYLKGQLMENGVGNGSYHLDAVIEGDKIPLNGEWSATKN